MGQSGPRNCTRHLGICTDPAPCHYLLRLGHQTEERSMNGAFLMLVCMQELVQVFLLGTGSAFVTNLFVPVKHISNNEEQLRAHIWSCLSQRPHSLMNIFRANPDLMEGYTPRAIVRQLEQLQQWGYVYFYQHSGLTWALTPLGQAWNRGEVQR